MSAKFPRGGGGSRTFFSSKSNSNQDGWGVSVFLKGYNFEQNRTVNSFLIFNDECAIVKEAKDANLLSQESKLKRINLHLNLCLSKSTTPVLKRILFQYLKVNIQP